MRHARYLTAFALSLAIVTTGLVALPISASSAIAPHLDPDQIRGLRQWVVLIAEDQIARGPNPRWFHRDCAGLIRFAVRESFRTHDEKWRQANGFLGRPLPPEIEVPDEMKTEIAKWNVGDGRSDYVNAFSLVRENSVFIGKSQDRLEPGDLLFFDQGQDQHVMLWTGRRVVYHNGSRPERNSKKLVTDNGLRAVTLSELLKWSDTRWQPTENNPNFIGFFRLSLLSSNGL